MPTTPQRLLLAGALADAAGRRFAPAAVLVDGCSVVAAGTPAGVGRPADAELVDLRQHVLLPGLVNAHTHLDLSHIGLVPAETGFVEWLRRIRPRRAQSEEAITESVALGTELARAGGTVLVGDIAGNNGHGPSLAAVEALRASPLGGVSYLEVFGLGPRQEAATAALAAGLAACIDDDRCVRVGVQPHAPYSCGPEVYRWAARCGAPISTHLAETHEEITFTRDGCGAIASFLEDLGAWKPNQAPLGGHPIDLVLDAIGDTPLLAAHVNYCDEKHMERLASAGATVAVCPRALDYFGHEDHPYRSLLDAGVNVALGTDGLLCLDTPERISVLDEMRLLYRRDGTAPERLLEMATIAGAGALGFETSLVCFDPGPKPGLLAISFDPADAADPLVQVLRRDDPPTWALEPATMPKHADAW